MVAVIAVVSSVCTKRSGRPHAGKWMMAAVAAVAVVGLVKAGALPLWVMTPPRARLDFFFCAWRETERHTER